MGQSANGVCFPSAADAAAAVCASYPRTEVSGGVASTWSCAGVASDASSLSLLRTDSTGAQSAQTLAVSFPACDESAQVNDIYSVWGLGLTACAAVWAIKAFVYRHVANQ